MEERTEIDSRQQPKSPMDRRSVTPDDLESRRCDSCKRIFKTAVGVKIHKTKMNCVPKLNLLHRAEEISGEAEESPSPEENHSAENLNVKGSPKVSTPLDSPVKERIKWPPMNDNKRWKAFEEDAVQTLNMVLKGSIEKRMEIFTNILHSMAKNAFGVIERKEKVAPNPRPNRREREIANIRKELKQLRKL